MAAGEIKLWGVVPRASERWKALTPIQRRKWIVIKKQYNRQTGSGQKERGKRYFQILSLKKKKIIIKIIILFQ